MAPVSPLFFCREMLISLANKIKSSLWRVPQINVSRLISPQTEVYTFEWGPQINQSEVAFVQSWTCVFAVPCRALAPVIVLERRLFWPEYSTYSHSLSGARSWGTYQLCWPNTQIESHCSIKSVIYDPLPMFFPPSIFSCLTSHQLIISKQSRSLMLAFLKTPVKWLRREGGKETVKAKRRQRWKLNNSSRWFMLLDVRSGNAKKREVYTHSSISTLWIMSDNRLHLEKTAN